MTVTSQRSLSLRRSSLVAPRAPTTIALKVPPRPRPRTHYRGCSHREPDLDDIAFCDHVVLAFEAHLAGRLGLGPPAPFHAGPPRRPPPPRPSPSSTPALSAGSSRAASSSIAADNATTTSPPGTTVSTAAHKLVASPSSSETFTTHTVGLSVSGAMSRKAARSSVLHEPSRSGVPSARGSDAR